MRDSISAYLDGVRVGETVVTFVTPWAFFAATLIGIIIGGLARFFGGKRRKRTRMLLRDIAKGAPFGLLAAIAGAIGLDWMHLKLDDSAALPAIVLTAALGAWLGSRLLERLAVIAGELGITRFTATYYADNLPVRRLLHDSGHVIASGFDQGEGYAVLDLTA